MPWGDFLTLIAQVTIAFAVGLFIASAAAGLVKAWRKK
jgi:hypothetical protein